MNPLLLFFIFTNVASSQTFELPPIRVSPPTVETEAETSRPVVERITEEPNVNFVSGANRPRFFQVRGLGEEGQFEHAQVNAVGLFYEGIDLSEEGSAVPLLGGERLDFRPGPQSLDWGGKTLAGSLNVRTCLEDKCGPSEVRIGAGNYRSQGLKGQWHSPGLFAGAGLYRSAGYYNNIYLDKPTSNRDERQLALGFKYRFGAAHFREHHLFVDHRNGYDSWSFTPSFETRSDRPGQDRHQVHGHSLQGELSAGDWTLRELTSLTVTQQREAYDEDWGNNVYWNETPGWNQDYDYSAQYERHRLKFHQKLSLGYGKNFEFGVHFSAYDEKQVIRSFKNGALRRESEPRFTTEGLGLWVSRDLWMGDWLWKNGVRAERQQIVARDTPIPLEWALDSRLIRFWRSSLESEWGYRRGFRGAGQNLSPGLPAENEYFSAEQIDSVHASVTHTQPNRRVSARLFYQSLHHQQARASLQLDPTDPDTFTYYTTNQGGSSSWGLETGIDQRWQSWRLLAALGLMDSAYRDYELAGRRLSGRALAQAPPWNYSVRTEFSPGPWTIYSQFTGRDGYFESVDHDFKTHPYHLVHLGTVYAWTKCSLSFEVRNVFDQRYAVRSFYFANEPPAWESKHYVQWGDPRTYWLELLWKI